MLAYKACPHAHMEHSQHSSRTSTIHEHMHFTGDEVVFSLVLQLAGAGLESLVRDVLKARKSISKQATLQYIPEI